MLSIYRLPNQSPHERVIKVIRRDLFIMFQRLLFSLFLFLAPIGLITLAALTMPVVLTGSTAFPLLILGLSAYYLFTWLFFFFSFIDYYLDVWIVTNERIIDIQQHGFFSRVIAEHKLFRVQDVTSEVHGLFPTMLGYGNVFVQTAGAQQRFVFREVPNPNDVRNLVIKLVERHRHEAQVEEAQEIRQIL